VGTHLVSTLAARGVSVLAISRNQLKIQTVKTLIVNDYAEVAEQSEALRGIDVLIHLAGLAHQPDAQDSAYWSANVGAAIGVARACEIAGVKRFVYVSSVAVYGPPLGRAFTEQDDPKPRGAYGESKLAAERALGNSLANTATDLVIVRPPMVWGPNCLGNYARLREFVSRSRCLPFGAFDEPRSSIHIDRLVDCLIALGCVPNVQGRIINVSDEIDRSLADMVRMLAQDIYHGKAVVVHIPKWIVRYALAITGRGGDYERMVSAVRVRQSIDFM